MRLLKETRENKTRKAPGNRVRRGDPYSCSVCGLQISVDEECNCVKTCDILCCGEPMKPVKKDKIQDSKKS